jgi:hypothetical protein
MKIIVKQDTTVWINGKPIEVKKGVQEIDDNIAIVLIESGHAEEARDGKETKAKR